MALIIEDGTIISGANSFATVAECRAFAELRGLELPAADAGVEILLIKAADFIFSLEANFQGYREDADQDLPFPRYPVTLYGTELATGVIPKILKHGQCRLAYDASLADLQATGAGRVVKKEGVGPLSVEYGDDGASNPQVQLTAALTILAPLFNFTSTAIGGQGINICVDR
tara:strand:- start:4739 stop:5254 length:516 start_codon:yes stop_codon:yes gene_type:complete